MFQKMTLLYIYFQEQPFDILLADLLSTVQFRFRVGSIGSRPIGYRLCVSVAVMSTNVSTCRRGV